MKSLAIVHLNKNSFSKIPDNIISQIKKNLPLFKIHIIESISELRKELKNCDYIIGAPFPATFIKKNLNLKEIFFLSSQVPDSFLNKPYKVHNITGVNNTSVCNYIQKQIKFYAGDKKLNILIIGQGSIGKLLKRRITIHHVKSVTRTPTDENDCSYDKYSELLSESNIIIPTVKLNLETKKLFTKNIFFDHLSSNSIIINTARGELFAEEELIEYLSQNPNSFYHTDVTFPEPYPKDGLLNNIKNITITPHIAGFEEGIWEKINSKLQPIISGWT